MKQSLILLLAASTIVSGCTEPGLNTSRSQVNSTTTNALVAVKSQPPTATNNVGTTDGLSPTPTNDIAAIRRLFAEYAAAVTAGDVSAVARLYEPDAIQLPPNSPALTGREAIRSKLESELKGIKVAATIKVEEVCPADHWAFARGSYRMVTTTQGGGDPQVTTGNWLDILKRQPDNSWKIVRATWSTED